MSLVQIIGPLFHKNHPIGHEADIVDLFGFLCLDPTENLLHRGGTPLMPFFNRFSFYSRRKKQRERDRRGAFHKQHK